jgi:exosortase J
VLGSHDTLICHSARGDDPVWQGQLTIPTLGNVPVSFSSAVFNDGATLYMEASTMCNAVACGEFATERTHLGFVYSRPDPKSLLTLAARRPIPILLRVETTDMSLSNAAARQQLTQNLQAFVASVRLGDLAQTNGP